jgi:hypothetical protein
LTHSRAVRARAANRMNERQAIVEEFL